MKRALKWLLFALLLICLLSFIALFSAEAGVLAGSIQLPPLLARHPVRTLAVLVVIVGVLSYMLWRLQSSTPEEKQAAEQRDRQRDRKAMLALVQGRVTKQLADSLQGATLQALGLRHQSEAVLPLLSSSLSQPDAPTQEETTIIHAYEEAEGKLLILGEPGAGKSTLLLQLAQHILTQAQDEKSRLPMPIIFNLASWAIKRQPLEEWMVEELHKMYQIHRKLGRAWVEADEILPLLDGWDEVAKEHQEACVDTINAFRQEHGLVATVVCSRKAEYWSQPRRFALERAVEVQPLASEQINKLLSSGGRELSGLRKALETDVALRELIPLPLMLNLMILAYQGMSVEAILHPSPLSTKQQQVLAAYVERRLQERKENAKYTQKETKVWLAWLAGQMTRKNQTDFYREQLQLDWLPQNLRRQYQALVRLGFGLVRALSGAVVFGLLFGLIGALVGGLFFGPVGNGGGALVGAVVGALVGAPTFFADRMEDGKMDESVGLSSGQIMSEEKQVWSWGSGLIGLMAGSVAGLIVGLFFGLINGLVFGLVFGLIVGLLVGLGPEQDEMSLEQHQRPRPNEMIQQSAVNGLVMGLLGGLVFGLVAGLIIGLVFGQVAGQVAGLLAGLLAGLGMGSDFGGVTVFQHYALRLVLWRAGSIPWHYMRFLDESADRLLLRKVGGSHSFVHRLLQDYFATLDAQPAALQGPQQTY